MSAPEILIVEDEPVVAQLLEHLLSALGYSVPAVAYSGEEALAAVDAKQPDLVLMDIRLGGAMDGIDTSTQLRARCRIPVIYLTAYGDDETVQRAKITAPSGYILKPFDTRELQITIEVALYKAQMEQERERLISELEEALANVKTLRGLIPICASCKKIRDDAGYWNDLEQYLCEHSEADFSHGICPECSRKLYGEVMNDS